MNHAMKRLGCLLVVMVLALSICGGQVAAADTGSTPTAWAQADIQALKNAGFLREEVFQNYQKPITRLEFIYLADMLYENMTHAVTWPKSDIHFSDTDSMDARVGATIGITLGTGDGRFSPDKVLTREDLAVMFVRTVELTGTRLTASTSRFLDDTAISGYARDAVYKASNHKILNGSGNRVSPKGTATKEQALCLMRRLLETFGQINLSDVLTPEQIAARETGVVKLVVEHPDEEWSTASAFYLTPDALVTNWHVLENAEAIHIDNGNGKLSTGFAYQVLAANQEKDLVIFTMGIRGVPMLLGDSSSVKKGQTVYTIGSPSGQRNTFSSGLVSNVATDEIQISAPIGPGSSGGVLLNGAGRVVGITSSIISGDASLGFAIPTETLRSLIRDDAYNQSLAEFVAYCRYEPPMATDVRIVSQETSAVTITWKSEPVESFLLAVAVCDATTGEYTVVRKSVPYQGPVTTYRLPEVPAFSSLDVYVRSFARGKGGSQYTAIAYATGTVDQLAQAQSVLDAAPAFSLPGGEHVSIGTLSENAEKTMWIVTLKISRAAMDAFDALDEAQTRAYGRQLRVLGQSLTQRLGKPVQLLVANFEAFTNEPEVPEYRHIAPVKPNYVADDIWFMIDCVTIYSQDAPNHLILAGGLMNLD